MSTKIISSFLAFHLFTAVCVPEEGSAQQIISGKLDWTTSANYDSFKGNKFDAVAKHYYFRAEQPFAAPSARISFVPKKVTKVSKLDPQLNPGPDFVFESAIVTKRKQQFLVYTIRPFRRAADGSVEKLEEWDISIAADQGYANKVAGRTYAANSVLASGTWRRLGIKEDGVYKLEYSSLKDMGIDPESIDPRNIQLFGRAGGMLPQSNAIARYDDLQEIAIEVTGSTDGKFDPGDVVLFYGRGPNQWSFNTSLQMYQRTQHAYCDSTYYFLTIGTAPGKRIASIASSGSTPTNTVSGYDRYAIVEEDVFGGIMKSLRSGREWYGEGFDFQEDRDYSFSIPNLDLNSPVTVLTAVAGRAESGGKVGVTVAGSKWYDVNFGSTLLTIPEANYAVAASQKASKLINSNSFTVSLHHVKANSESNAWVNYVLVNARTSTTYPGGVYPFTDRNTQGGGAITKYFLQGLSASGRVWDITNPIAVAAQELLDDGAGQSTFVKEHSSEAYFLAFREQDASTPSYYGLVSNQNLHAIQDVDLVIVSQSNLRAQAERLASFRHTNDGLDVVVVSPQQIYNEFSSGVRDVTAIREFVKMLYDRGGSNPRIKYLLLFGDGSFDNKSRKYSNSNFIPTYQSFESFSPTNSYVSDDYLGLLDDSEGAYLEFNTIGEVYDIGIGRLPVQTEEQASVAVDKLLRYSSSEALSDWRTKLVFVADDGNGNRHLHDAEEDVQVVTDRTSLYNIEKIYFDAYQQQSTAGGNRYPDAQNAINQAVNRGSLIFNYTGHGGEVGLAHERVMTLSDINNWNNLDNMSLFITATCSFSRWDDPAQTSAGEQAFLNPKGGPIALFTTSRTVYSVPNLTLNKSMLAAIFDTVEDGNIVRLGDVFSQAKNEASGGGVNSRNFSLLGDPSMSLSFPRLKVNTSTINGHLLTLKMDTIKALSKIKLEGWVSDKNGVKQSNYSGIVYAAIYDKVANMKTLGNDLSSSVSDDYSYPQAFQLRKNVIYKGKATVKDGDFSVEFIVPKDINYQFGMGRISLYASNGSMDGIGSYDSIMVGGISSNIIQDKEGPTMKLFLNEQNFVSGGTTNENPVLHLKLTDENGVNTVGNGIGHDITATLQKANSPDKVILLNDFYSSDLDNYKSGAVKYPLSKLEEGRYHLKVKAWDVYNNSSETSVDFVVAASAEMKLAHILNYPNPFSNRTMFQFEHNQATGAPIDVLIQIYTVSGKLIKTIRQTSITESNRIDGIYWDGKDDFGDRLGRGVYFYKLQAKMPSGINAVGFEKLVILN